MTDQLDFKDQDAVRQEKEMSELCPEARSRGDLPPWCNLSENTCVDDPDLECDFFIGYLHDTLYPQSRQITRVAAMMIFLDEA